MGLAALFLAVLVADAVLAGPVPQPEPQHKQQLAERAELVKYTQSQLDAAEQRLQEARTALIKVRPLQPGPCWASLGLARACPNTTSPSDVQVHALHHCPTPRPALGPCRSLISRPSGSEPAAARVARGSRRRLRNKALAGATTAVSGMLQAPSRGGVGRGGERAAYPAPARRVQPAVA